MMDILFACWPVLSPLPLPRVGGSDRPGLGWHGPTPQSVPAQAQCHCSSPLPDRDVHRLVFPAVGLQHAGVYKSVIANKLGKAACYAHLYVTGEAGTLLANRMHSLASGLPRGWAKEGPLHQLPPFGPLGSHPALPQPCGCPSPPAHFSEARRSCRAIGP